MDTTVHSLISVVDRFLTILLFSTFYYLKEKYLEFDTYTHYVLISIINTTFLGNGVLEVVKYAKVTSILELLMIYSRRKTLILTWHKFVIEIINEL